MTRTGSTALRITALCLVARAVSAQGAPPQQQQYDQQQQQPGPPPQQQQYDQQPPPPGPPPQQQQYGQQPPPPSAPPPQQQYGAPPQGQYTPPPNAPLPAREPVVEPEPPPPRSADPEGGGFKMPPWSVRIDPLNWLLYGRLGFEIEAGITKWMTAELVPVFVANDSPPAMSFKDVGPQVTQHSNGLGPLAGTSLGLGFWLGGTEFHGYVLRAIFTDYGYTYRTADSAGIQVDQHTHTDRWLMAMLGSQTMFGPFTIAGGLGLGVDLNKESRCFASNAVTIQPVSSGCSAIDLALGQNPSQSGVVDVSGPFYPVVLAFRFSLGVTFE